jgi:hypothetical protein
MRADPRSLLVLQGMHNGADILWMQASFKDRIEAAMRDEIGARELETLYHQIYHDFANQAQSPGPGPTIGYDEAIKLRGSVSFLKNLANGVIENCIGWYSESLIAGIFNATKVKELGHGSTLDLITPSALDSPQFAIEVKSCRWSNTHLRTHSNGRSYPVGRSMYYFKHNQLLEANSVNHRTPAYFALVDYDFRWREQLSFKQVKDEIRRAFGQTKITDSNLAIDWFAKQIVVRGVWLIPSHYITHIWNTNISTTRTDRGVAARARYLRSPEKLYTQFYFKWALEQMITDLSAHGNRATEYAFEGIQREPMLMRVHNAVGYLPETPPFDLRESPLAWALIPRRHQTLVTPTTQDLFE